MPDIEPDFSAELAQVQAESIGWIPLQVGAYLNVGPEETKTIEMVGNPSAEMQG